MLQRPGHDHGVTDVGVGLAREAHGLLRHVEEETRDHRIRANGAGSFCQRRRAAHVDEHEDPLFAQRAVIAPEHDVGQHAAADEVSHHDQELENASHGEREAGIPRQIVQGAGGRKSIGKQDQTAQPIGDDDEQSGDHGLGEEHHRKRRTPQRLAHRPFCDEEFETEDEQGDQYALDPELETEQRCCGLADDRHVDQAGCSAAADQDRQISKLLAGPLFPSRSHPLERQLAGGSRSACG